jgi:hypothetical protein
MPSSSFRFNGELCVENPDSLGFYDVFSGVQTRHVTKDDETLPKEQTLPLVHHVGRQLVCLCQLCSATRHVMVSNSSA